MTTSGGAQLGIGEFARQCGLSISALRFYDECGLIQPAEVDPSTGYRSYDEAQLDLALLIRDLRRLELPLAAVREVLALPGPERHKAIDEQLAALADRLQEAREVAEGLHARLDQLEASMTMTVNGRDLADALGHVLVAVGTDKAKPQLHGVLVEAKEGSLRLVATDSHRLAVRDLHPASVDATTFRAVAHAGALREALDWMMDQPALGVAREEDGLVLSGRADSRQIAATDADFPNYEPLLAEAGGGHRAVAPLAEFLDALDTLPDAPAIRLTFSAGGIEVDADGERRSVAAEYAGEGLKVHLNPTYIRDAAVAAVGPDLAIEATTAVEPVVFRSADDGTAVTLVMPVKVS